MFFQMGMFRIRFLQIGRDSMQRMTLTSLIMYRRLNGNSINFERPAFAVAA